MNRTTYLVDGFNLYHSLCDAELDFSRTTKWLDLHRLCSDYLPEVGKAHGEKTSLGDIWFFTAPPIHKSPAKQARHDLYMRCLRGTGIRVELGQFKAHKEKETDVAIACMLLRIGHQESADSVVVISGDTDLAPAARTFIDLFPSKTLLFAFPYNRANDELRHIARGSFKIHAKAYFKRQFPDPLVLEDGTSLRKPSMW